MSGCGPPPGTYDLAGITGFRLSVLSNRLTLWAARVYEKEFGVGVLEWRVMAPLGLLGRATAGEIAELTVLDKSNVSRAVRRLTDRQLIERSDDPRDRRKKILSLTPGGRELHDRIALRSLERERSLFADWTDGERETFVALVKRIDARAVELLEGTNG